MEDAFKSHRLPKVDVYGDQLLVSARTARSGNFAVILVLCVTRHVSFKRAKWL
ncbi:hypothetical protein [Muricoccus aerilatus]|uniref:hypothetical protein n=1 Tax=Muricoccus aerilatus TaxID=452982 RepID=UPI000B31E308|nr:hypothetical protein [Roseomonas aerilata]